MIDWDSYRDPLGFMAGQKNPTQPESNAVLFSAIERRLRIKLGTWTAIEQTRLEKALAGCIQIPPGRLVRPIPWTQDPEGPDNHIGLGACGDWASCALIACRLERLPWAFKFFSVRFPAIMAHLDWSYEIPWLWKRLWWAISVALWPIDPAAQDPWVQNWLMVEQNGDRGKIERWASNRFLAKLKSVGGLSAVLTRYWNAEHPAVQACVELGI